MLFKSDITVIIPSYNMQLEVIRALNSVITQTIPCEIIVVDDYSFPPLEFPKILQGNNRVRLIRQNSNLGASAARNLGIRACKTEWLTFLDSDDQFLPDTLERRLQFAKDMMDQINGGLGKENTFFSCGWIDPNLGADRQQVRIPNSANSPEEFASGCWYSSGSCAIFHHSFFEVKGRKYDESLRRLEDFDWGIRAGLSGARMVSHPIAGVSIHPSNKTDLQAIKVASAQILENFSHLRNSHPKIFASLSAYLALELSTFSCRENKWLGALFELIRSITLLPRLRRHFSPGWTYKKYEVKGANIRKKR